MGQQKDVVEVDAAQGVFSVCDKLWVVGTRYQLHEHIGSGSYGDVCRATDLESRQIVALKRIPDVFFCHMLAKRVLREVCIMRRLKNPYIINLSNVFTAANLEIEEGIDLYIATEYADRGDMYHLKEPLQPEHVKLLVWQLLSGVNYLHSCQVWHRDIKSENILLTSNLLAKICDFGLSRSAVESSSNLESRYIPTIGRRTPSRKPILKRQYTKNVVTPSYRAPEVVMSQGQYSSAIDIWALGCIFWELLVRLQSPNRRGPPPRPLFGVRGEPNTPLGGEVYSEDGNSKLSEQLDVIFDVIGTPCWKDIESVPSESWRSYLKQIPGRAGNLVQNLSGFADDESLDLLSRMLAFDPARRCTAREALAHTYFNGLESISAVPMNQFEYGTATHPEDPVWKINDPAIALGLLEKELENSMSLQDGGRQKLEFLLQREIERQQEQSKAHKTLLRNLVLDTFAEASKVRAPELYPDTPIFPMASGSGVVLNQEASQRLLSNISMRDQQSDSLETSGIGSSALASELPTSASMQYLNAVQEPAVKKSRGRKKTIIKQGSFRIELNSFPSPQPVRESSRLAKQRIQDVDKAVQAVQSVQSVQPVQSIQSVQSVPEVLPRRSPRLRETHAQGELPHRKRVCLGAV